MGEKKKVSNWRIFFPVLGAILGGLMIIPISGTFIAWFSCNFIANVFHLEGWSAFLDSFIVILYLIYLGCMIGMFFLNKWVAIFMLIIITFTSLHPFIKTVKDELENVRQKVIAGNYISSEDKGRLWQRVGCSPDDIEALFNYYGSDNTFKSNLSIFPWLNRKYYDHEDIKKALDRFKSVSELSKYFEVNEEVIEEIIKEYNMDYILLSGQKKYIYYEFAQPLNSEGLLKNDKKELLYY